MAGKLPGCLKCPCSWEQRRWGFCNEVLAQALGSSSIPGVLHTVLGQPRGCCWWDPCLLGQESCSQLWEGILAEVGEKFIFCCSVFSFFLHCYLFTSLAVSSGSTCVGKGTVAAAHQR